MSLFRPNPTELPRTHERIFVDRYADILSWALKLTRGDVALAHDLTHDAFIQFTLGCPDLDTIQNLDSYLYGVLRNLHISHLRKAFRDALQTLAPGEFDSIYLVLAADGNTPVAIQNELRQICAFACRRKETSKSASILILRFFYAYLPKEVGDLSLLNTSGVYNLLLTARREISRAKRSNWELPGDRLRAPRTNDGAEVRAELQSRAIPVDALLAELRHMLFAARHSACLPADSLLAFYRDAFPEPIECSLLAHLVSCQQCLDLLNDFMKRPRIDQRVPGESMDSDQAPDNSDKTRDSGSTLRFIGRSGSLKTKREELHAAGLRRREQIYQHWPARLSIAVNGELQASQAIQAETSELKAHVDRSVRAEFVEVFSEQGLRLLLAGVADVPPEGPQTRQLFMGLSNGRQLEAILEFGSQGLSITIRYHDPQFATVEASERNPRREATIVLPSDLQAQPRTHRRVLVAQLWRTLGQLMPSTGWALSTASGVLAVAGIFFYSHRPATHLDAGDLLARTEAQEQQTVVAGWAEHRTFHIEKLAGDGALTSLGHTDMWRNGEKSAQRFYDDQGQLLAGEWRDAQHFWSYNQADGLTAQKQTTEDASATPGTVWQTEPSADAFSRVAQSASAIKSAENATEYTLDASLPDSPTAQPHLARAVLVIARKNLHARSETMWFSDGEAYRVVETSFDQMKMSDVSPDIFSPPLRQRHRSSLSSPGTTSMDKAGLIRLEVQVLAALNGIGADVGDPITMTRESSGEGRVVRLSGMVDTPDRRQQVFAALSSLLRNPRLIISLNTPEDLGKQMRKRRRPPIPTSSEVFDSTDESIPAYNDLKAYFARQGYQGQELDNHIRSFSFAVLERSSDAAQQASAMKRLTDAFSADELASLDNESRALWLRMLESHARDYDRNINQLQTSLALIYPDQAIPPGGFHGTEQGLEPKTLAALATATQTIFNSTITNDATIRSAFSLSHSPERAAALKTIPFYGALAQAKQTTAAVFGVAEKLQGWASLHSDPRTQH
jgi:DNA-directed RNA polymerase specialized sigma24 family protein